MSNVYERKLCVIIDQIQPFAKELLAREQPLLHDIFSQQGKEDWGRSFGNHIHDMPVDWSKAASHKAIARKLRNLKYKPSRDHYNSRQRCGEQLVDLITRKHGAGKIPTRREIEDILVDACKVHYVTEQENQNVRPFMAKGLSHKQAYKKAGIVLWQDTDDLFSQRGPKSKTWIKAMHRKYGKVLKE